MRSFAYTLSGLNELIVLGGDGDDVIDLSGIARPAFDTLILGGPGADVLIGSGGDDTIFGGPGDDVLIGGPGIDCLNGGPGNNIAIQAACGGPEPVIKPLPRASVPEPGSLLLLTAGLGGLLVVKRSN